MCYSRQIFVSLARKMKDSREYQGLKSLTIKLLQKIAGIFLLNLIHQHSLLERTSLAESRSEFLPWYLKIIGQAVNPEEFNYKFHK